ncbi:GMC family oxidoreductase [Noviherbaspirillum saxi]|uniref:Choline dehydrogenase n=1 Tax=Noviherbaspirillum saxi TaxID=2320863 RepID=A0A3A3FGP2_9BURK|nr:choline dehydrogenase [Noviherbaspirillum saxi]RJF92297.1 choline dehydrogenase [Noviherbaspirillum saxi]
MSDYIIIGAGSAGCILANRLSNDPKVHVTLIEAGGKDSSLMYRMPAGYFEIMKSGMGNWNFETTPQSGLNGRTMYVPRGKVLGGSSSINGMAVSWGNPGDYDHWADLGNPGWAFHDCLPYFKLVESFANGDETLRGRTGPVGVTQTTKERISRISQSWVQAAIEAGHGFNEDYNAKTPEGISLMQGNYANGLRQSTAHCYLRPAMARPNLKIISNALVRKIVVKNGRAIGVEYSDRSGQHFCQASREVILSGGAINSPQLLQLSGIGNPDDITPHDIAVVHELPGVGRNLRDHLSVSVKQKITKPYSALSNLRPVSMVSALAQYLMFRKGPAATNGLESWAHAKTRKDIEYPDVQVYCLPLMFSNHGRDLIRDEGFMASVTGSRPNSVGTVKIVSADPTAPPAIDPNYLADPDDLRVLRDGLRIARDIIAQKAFDEFRGVELAPGKAANADTELDAYIRENALSIYHPVGTCKMGADANAVVDTSLRVRGLDGLRVIDASVMPNITSGNTNFPVMMLAEKGAEIIMRDAK